jgi:hypothetical protein
VSASARGIAVVAAALALSACAAPPALAAFPSSLAILAANSDAGGRIDLLVIGPSNQSVNVFEVVGGERRHLADTTVSGGLRVPDGRVLGPSLMRGVATWSCTRREREFVATTPDPQTPGATLTATSRVRTGSCRKRFALTAPRLATRGARVRIKVTDRFKLGDIRPKLCVTPPGRAASCRLLDFRGSTASRTVKVGRAGRWRIGLRGPDQSLKSILSVGVGETRPASPEPNVVLYGDSIMSQLAVPIEDGLPLRTRVTSILSGGGGLSDPKFDWPERARSRTNSLHPKVSLVGLGGSDGSALSNPFAPGTTVACCGAAWVAAYGAQVEEMLRILTADGGRVVWIVNPAAEAASRQGVLAAVETAVRRVVPTVRGAAIVDLGDTLSPGNVYSETIGGTKVRTEDGLHLTLPGADIGARQVLRSIGSIPLDPPPPPTCTFLKGKQLAKCKVDRKTAQRCGKLKGAKRSRCARQIRAQARRR